MKKLVLILLLLPFACGAQVGYLNTVAGTGSYGSSGIGGPATSANIAQPTSVAVDNNGNIYFRGVVIWKVGVDGIFTIFAGGGSSTADNILATDAGLHIATVEGLTTDNNGDVYIVDSNRVRKITVSTGIITTIAGGLSSGYDGDGGPATSAHLNSPHGICLDANGNLYIGDEGNAVVRKVNTSGTISTYAGTGTAGFSGDGGVATSAQLKSPDGVCVDASGNLYIADRLNYRVRKVTPAGLITTYAGNGTTGNGGDGGFATSASFSGPSSVCLDIFSNLYIADYPNSRIRKITQNGMVSTYAGGGSSTANNIPATSATFNGTWGVCTDMSNNIYLSDRDHPRICKVTGVGSPAATADSFWAFTNASCNNLAVTITPAHYNSSLLLKTWFGDGTTEVDSFCSVTGYPTIINHTYNTSGTYTIKQVLYNNNNPVDSVTYNHNYLLCATAAMHFYYDENANCAYDPTEFTISQPALIEVDSNNIAIDTVSATSGFYYTTYGNTGDVFGFKVIAAPAGFNATCPISETFYDTLGVTTLGTTIQYFGLQCISGSAYDLNVNAVIPVTGTIDQIGHIYVQNAYCMPENATVTLHYSAKYPGIPDLVSDGGVVGTDNTITWNLSALSSLLTQPVSLDYRVWMGADELIIGDTVHSYVTVTPTTGDVDTLNNSVIVIDTVRAGCDPNEMWVTPTCMESGATANLLRYTINFENTGNDTAHNIYVLDTLPANVDASSFRIEMASHQMYTSKYTDGAGHTIMKFDFPAINLLDSSHHGQCDGAIIFNVKSKPGLADGADVANRAGIYFDVNAVVMTNQVDTKVGGCTAITTAAATVANAHKVGFYPNPATTELMLTMDKDAYSSLTITNSIGQEVLAQHISNATTKVNIAGLAAGVYYMEVKGDSGGKVLKFVKM